MEAKEIIEVNEILGVLKDVSEQLHGISSNPKYKKVLLGSPKAVEKLSEAAIAVENMARALFWVPSVSGISLN